MTNKRVQDKDEEKYLNSFSSVIFLTLYPQNKVNFTSEIENMFNMQEVYLSYCRTMTA